MTQKEIDGQLNFFDLLGKSFVGKDKSITNFKRIKSMSINELATWLNQNCNDCDNPWLTWMSKKYCDNCMPVEKCFPCELEGCPYGLSTMSNEDLIKLWFREKCNEI